MKLVAGKLETRITYLEMTEPPSTPAAPIPALKLAMLRAEQPSVAFYRFLYNTVGEPWLWWERRQLSDDALSAIIGDPLVEIYVLYVGGVPAGFSELDRRRKPDIELAYFGLMEDFIGRGLGRFLLRWTIDQAWTRKPRRLWVHTCDLDHPRSLAIYQQAGFVPYRQATEIIDDPRLSGAFPAANQSTNGPESG
ncbi:MAG: GNAT family N-acetyltransferase [Rhodospirillales bacterium]|jgi:GNAT superfamily N-acetyltransferase|nr:GNAT family N-acetyltransferase [Rhodospirillales bacterium]